MRGTVFLPFLYDPHLSITMALFPSLAGSFGLYSILTLAGFVSQAGALQCYGCNVMHGQRYVDLGCSSPEVITCSHTHKGFKQRFCIRTESMALGILLTSGCATSRHCHQQELPGVRIHCCDSDLCNNTSSWHPGALHYLCTLASLLLVWLYV